MMSTFYWILGVLIFLSFFSVRACAQYRRAVVFRLGKQVRVSGPGIYLLIPFIEYKNLVDIFTQTTDLSSYVDENEGSSEEEETDDDGNVIQQTQEQPKQEAITSDNVPVKTDAVVWWRVTNPAKSIVEIGDVEEAVALSSITALRAQIGSQSLDVLLKTPETLATAITAKLAPIAAKWGVVVERVEVRGITIPASMQRAIAAEAEADRERKARLIKADAEFQASKKLCEAAKLMESNPMALELRRFQMMTEIGVEQNTSTIVMMPSDFLNVAKSLVAPKTKRAKRAK